MKTLPNPEMLKIYQQIRNIGKDINSQAFELLDGRDMLEVAKKLCIAQGNTLVFQNESETQIMWNYAMHHYRINNLNTLNRYALTIKTELPDLEKQVLTAMCNSTFSIFELKETLPYGGIVVQDIFNKKAHLLIDKNMSMMDLTDGKSILFGSNLIHFQDFSITTGASVVVTSKLLSEFQSYLIIFLEKYNHFDDALTNALDRIVTHFLKCALRTDASEFCSYQEL